MRIEDILEHRARRAATRSDPYWSERILAEVTRNLILDRRATEEQASNPKDRHVLTAVVASKRASRRHTQPQTLPERRVRAATPDSFLLDLYSLDSDGVLAVLERQAATLTQLPMTINDLLQRLAATVPSFAQALRAHS